MTVEEMIHAVYGKPLEKIAQLNGYVFTDEFEVPKQDYKQSYLSMHGYVNKGFLTNSLAIKHRLILKEI